MQNYGTGWEACDDGTAHYGLNFMVIGTETTGISEIGHSINFLRQNSPNPFRDITTISFELTETCYGNLAVYNTIGQNIETLKDGKIEAGKHDVVFNSHHLPSGIYYYQLSTSIGIDRKQMILIR